MRQKKKTLILQRNEDIVKMFNSLSSIKEFGVQKYSLELILNRIKRRFYLEVETIIKIVKETAQ
jgi:hypothetical protein